MSTHISCAVEALWVSGICGLEGSLSARLSLVPGRAPGTQKVSQYLLNGRITALLQYC